MSLSRRQFARTGLGLAATSLLPWAAGCAGPRASAVSGSTVAPGVYRIRLGDTTITSISDGSAARPLDANFVRNASLAQVQQALKEAGLPTDQLTLTFSAFVVESGGRRVLMDSGNGQFGAATAGRVQANLRAAGIDPASIDAVLISHFHGDHINGLRNRDGALAYPKARIHVPAPEWNFWMDDARMAAAPENVRGGFQGVRRVFGPIAASVQRFEPGRDPLPGISSIAAYGHTPGHTAFSLRAGGQTFVYLGDLTNIPALFVRNPDWAVAFDMDADLARQTRRRLLDAAVDGNWIVGAAHWPTPAIGRVVRRGNGYDLAMLR